MTEQTLGMTDGIPTNPSSQLALLRRTDNGLHLLDPAQLTGAGDSISQHPYPEHLVGAQRLATLSIQAQLLNNAKSHLGYHEDSHGDSVYGIWYGDQPSVHDNGFNGAAWCDMFLAKMTYDTVGANGLKTIGDFAFTPWHAAFLHDKGMTSRPAKLLPGSFAFQNWDLNGTGNGNLSKIDHVEIVETDHGDGTATYVGGNVGNAVKRSRRSKAYLVVVAEWWKLLPDPSPSPAPSVGHKGDWYINA